LHCLCSSTETSRSHYTLCGRAVTSCVLSDPVSSLPHWNRCPDKCCRNLPSWSWHWYWRPHRKWPACNRWRPRSWPRWSSFILVSGSECPPLSAQFIALIGYLPVHSWCDAMFQLSRSFGWVAERGPSLGEATLVARCPVNFVELHFAGETPARRAHAHQLDLHGRKILFKHDLCANVTST